MWPRGSQPGRRGAGRGPPLSGPRLLPGAVGWPRCAARPSSVRAGPRPGARGATCGQGRREAAVRRGCGRSSFRRRRGRAGERVLRCGRARGARRAAPGPQVEEGGALPRVLLSNSSPNARTTGPIGLMGHMGGPAPGSAVSARAEFQRRNLLGGRKKDPAEALIESGRERAKRPRLMGSETGRVAAESKFRRADTSNAPGRTHWVDHLLRIDRRIRTPCRWCCFPQLPDTEICPRKARRVINRCADSTTAPRAAYGAGRGRPRPGRAPRRCAGPAARRGIAGPGCETDPAGSPARSGRRAGCPSQGQYLRASRAGSLGEERLPSAPREAGLPLGTAADADGAGTPAFDRPPPKASADRHGPAGRR